MSPTMILIFLILFIFYFLFFISFSPLQPSLFCLLFFFLILIFSPSLPRILSYVFSFFLILLFFFLLLSLLPSPILFGSPSFRLPFFSFHFLLPPPTHSKSHPLPLKHGKVEKWVCRGDPMSHTTFFLFF